MTAAIIILSVLLFCALTVFAVDAWFYLWVWLKRIHIGSKKDKNEWVASVTSVCTKWLKKPPLMPVGDNRRYLILPLLKGEFKNKHFMPWQQASLILGLSENAEASEAVKSFANGDAAQKIIDSPYSIGNAMLLFALGKTPFSESESIRKASALYAGKILSSAGDGTLGYQIGSQVRYVDSIGMLCPFLMQYAAKNSCRPAAELAMRQIEEYIEFGFEKNTQVPVHCFSQKSKAPLGLYGWGRGCGWFAIGIADSYLQIKNCPQFKGEAERLCGIITEYADTLIKWQNADGAFSTDIFTDGVRDSSATAFIGWLFSTAYGITGDEKYASAAKKCLTFIMSVTRVNGEVDMAQGDTLGSGLYSSSQGRMPAAQGFALRLANSEDIR